MGQHKIFFIFSIKEMKHLVWFVVWDLDHVLVKISFFVAILCLQGCISYRRFEVSDLVITPHDLRIFIDQRFYWSLHHCACEKRFPGLQVSFHVINMDDSVSEMHLFQIFLEWRVFGFQHLHIFIRWNLYVVEVHFGAELLNQLDNSSVSKPWKDRVVLLAASHVLFVKVDTVINSHDQVELGLAHFVFFLIAYIH